MSSGCDCSHLCMDIYSYLNGMRHCSVQGEFHHIGVGSDVVHSYRIGQCESLLKWDEQQVGSPRFFIGRYRHHSCTTPRGTASQTKRIDETCIIEMLPLAPFPPHAVLREGHHRHDRRIDRSGQWLPFGKQPKR